jgi:PhoPQ-activated pathogenicity-related protein
MDYQIETWGRYSEQIIDYSSKGLIKRMQDEQTEPLWSWVDPFTYRSKLTLPKLIINGTNDRYWTVDALNNYWSDLEGQKFIHYVPNAGHNLQGGPGSREAALATLAAFFEHVVLEKALPTITWIHAEADQKHRLTITTNSEPTAVKLWYATSATKDFRQAKWTSSPLKGTTKSFVGEIAKPDAGHSALFGEVQFQMPTGTTYSLSTQLKRE